MKSTLCMMVSSHVLSDPRVTKEAATLAPHYQVFVVGKTEYDIETKQYQDDQTGIHFCLIHHGFKLRYAGKMRKVMAKLWTNLKIAWKAYQIDAAVYHAHDLDMLPFAYVIKLLKKSRLIYDSHELWIEQDAALPHVVKNILRKMEHYLIHRVDRVITVNPSIAQELQRRYQLTTPPTVIYNFTMKIERVRNPVFQREDNQVIILYHGGYNKDRGLEELLESSTHFDDSVQFQLRGSGPLRDQLMDQVKRQGLQNVTFLDPISMEQLVAAAVSADIGIIPYQPNNLNNYFSLPNKLSEYAMAGLAICASDVPEIRRIQEAYTIGELFNPYEPESIAQAIHKLVSNPEHLAKCKQHALQWALNHGHWGCEEPKLRLIYEQLLGENHEQRMDY